MRNLILLAAMLSASGCERILGPRHEVTMRFEVPEWQESSYHATPEDIERTRQIVEKRLRARKAVAIKIEPVSGKPNEFEYRFSGDFSEINLKSLLGSGRLEFRMMIGDKTFADPKRAGEERLDGPPQNADLIPSISSPENPEVLWYPLEKQTRMTNCDLLSTHATTDSSNRPALGFTFTEAAGIRFGELTRNNLKRRMAIIVNGKVVTAPTIESEIDANGIIHGSFTDEEIDTLVAQLNAGCMPLQPVILEMK